MDFAIGDERKSPSTHGLTRMDMKTLPKLQAAGKFISLKRVARSASAFSKDLGWGCTIVGRISNAITHWWNIWPSATPDAYSSID